MNNNPPFLSLTIARNDNDFGGPKRRFNVPSEMASGYRPPTPRKPKPGMGHERERMEIDLELALARGPLYRFILRFLPIFLGVLCGMLAVCTAYVDFNARWSYTTQARYAGFAKSHNEMWRPQQMPTIFKIVDILTDYRNMKEQHDSLQNDGVVTPNATPQEFLSRSTATNSNNAGLEKISETPMDLLAVGTARVAAEAVRSDDPRPWNLYVPRTISELMNYDGDTFVDGIIVGGDEQAFFPVTKTYSFLHTGGIVVHQIPAHVDGRPIYAQYQMVFGRPNVRSEFISAGSRIIVARKEQAPKVPGTFSSPEMEGYRENNMILDYHYLVM